jgi:hypothetical protein
VRIIYSYLGSPPIRWVAHAQQTQTITQRLEAYPVPTIRTFAFESVFCFFASGFDIFDSYLLSLRNSLKVLSKATRDQYFCWVANNILHRVVDAEVMFGLDTDA